MAIRSNPRTFSFGLDPLVGGLIAAPNADPTKADLGAWASAVNDDYNARRLYVRAGTGLGLPPFLIIDYDGAAKRATVSPPFPAGLLPDGTTDVAIYAALSSEDIIGLCQAGSTPNSIVLADKESLKDSYLAGLPLDIVAGVGRFPNERYEIVKYTGATRTAIVEPRFRTTPDGTSYYRIQGHLYFPVSGLDIYMTDNSNFLVGTKPGIVGMGLGALTSKYPQTTEVENPGYLELVTQAALKTLNAMRWE